MINKKILVAGAGGFIGGNLINFLRSRGHQNLRAVDIKPLDQWFQRFDDVDNHSLNLQKAETCRTAVEGMDIVYNLAANMGGMGFIENNKTLCMLSVLINTHLLEASRIAGVTKFFYASSACVYAADKQKSEDVIPLAEADAYPAMPEDGYGWEKLFSERMCRHYHEDFGLEIAIARFHNVYGPMGTYDGGREKAPAAICRKVINTILDNSHEIEIWGDGIQTRSFTYIEDCLKGVNLLMGSDVQEPLNIGSSELVTINGLVDIVESIAGIELKRTYNLDAPKGVNGRNSDNTLIKSLFQWEPSTRLKDGMEKTYQWIYDQMVNQSSAEKARFTRP